MLDKEAAKRVQSKYIGKIHLPMLPPNICRKANSLVQGEVRDVLSLFFFINDEGVILLEGDEKY